MNGIKCYITCPKCGRMLLKSKEGSEIELQCPKCKANLEITHTGNAVLVKEETLTYNCESK